MFASILSAVAAASLPICLEPTAPIVLKSPQALPTYGAALALSDEYLLVGEPTQDKIGGAYLYDLAAPAQVADSFFPAIDLMDAAGFGTAIDIVGGLLVLGAPYENSDNLSNIGALYTYTLNGDVWQEQPLAKLVPLPTANDNFGRSLALDGLSLVVGAPGTDAPPNFEAGRLHAYQWNGAQWIEQAIAPGPPVQNARLGVSVAIAGSRIAAFSPGTAEVIFFEKDINDAWTEQQRLSPLDFAAAPCAAAPKATSDSVWSLQMQGDELLIGVFDHDTDATVGSSEGAVFVFSMDGGKFVCAQRIESPTPQESELFGFSLARRADVLFVGAPGRNSRVALSGAVYGYAKVDQAWTVSSGPLEMQPQNTEDTFGCALDLSARHLAVSSCSSAMPQVTLFELKGSLGEACSDLKDCADGVCADGVCCDDPVCASAECWTCASPGFAGMCRFAEGMACSDQEEGCNMQTCTSGDPGTTGGGGSTGEASTGGEPGEGDTSPTTGASEDAATGDDAMTDTSAATNTATGGVGFDPDDVLGGCVCQARPRGDGAALLGVGLIALLLGARRRRSD